MEDVYGFEDQTKIEDVLAECEITRRDKEVNQTVQNTKPKKLTNKKTNQQTNKQVNKNTDH